MPRDKAPGPDRFPVEFYIATWPILGGDVTIVQSFFLSLWFSAKRSECHYPLAHPEA